MPTSISKSEKEADFKKIEKLILSLERKADDGQLTIEALREYQNSFNRFTDKYINDSGFSRKDKGLFKPIELRALIFLAQGDESMADNLLSDAASLKHPDEEWVSYTAKKWESNNATQLYGIENTQSTLYSGNIEGWLAFYSLGFLITPFLLFYDLFVSAPQFKNELSSISKSVANDLEPFYNFAVVYDVLVLVFISTLAFYFFQKKRETKYIAIAFHIFILIGGFITYLLLNDFSTKYGVELDSGGSVLSAAAFIWPFYWLISKRVKATFIH